LNNPIMLIDPTGMDAETDDMFGLTAGINKAFKEYLESQQENNNEGSSAATNNSSGSNNFSNSSSSSSSTKGPGDGEYWLTIDGRWVLVKDPNNPPQGAVSPENWKKALQWGLYTYDEIGALVEKANGGPKSIDYVGLGCSDNFFNCLGIGGDVTIAWVRGDGIFMYPTFRGGGGIDDSMGPFLTLGTHSGNNPLTGTSTAKWNTYWDVGFDLINVGGQKDIAKDKFGHRIYGSNWNYTIIGLSFGSKTFFGGSKGRAYTLPPLYIYKFKK
jgi:hypothetical protein